MTKAHKHPPKPIAQKPSFFGSLSPTMQDAVCVAVLYLVTLFVFRAMVFENAAFQTGGDTANAHSYYQIGTTLEQQEGVDAIWMPYFFSGMPTFGNVAYVPHNVSYAQTAIVWLLNWFFLHQTWTWLVVYYFLGAAFMFLLLRVLGFDRLPSLFGALTFLLSPYGIGLAGEGHGSKLMALNYLPAVFLLTHLLVERRNLLSFGLLSVAIGTLMLTNHMQIVYYVFLLVGLYLLMRVLLEVRSAPLRAAWRSAMFAGALLVGFAIASYIYLSVYDYSGYSIRGGGTGQAMSGGLPYDYATGWSWHPLEMFTLLIPGFFGMKVDLYWGSMQPWTNSSVYAGLLPLALSVVALIYRRTALVVFLGIVTLLVVLLSMGNNFPLLYDLCFAYLPFFNKFRAPAMILHLLPFLLGILGTYGLAFLLASHERVSGKDGAQARKAILYAVIVLVGLAVLVLAGRQGMFASVAGSLLRGEELQQVRQQYGARAEQAIPQIPLVIKRFDLLWKDLVKFLLLAAAALGAYSAFARKKLSATAFTVTVLALLTIDLVLVAGKYIEPKPSAVLEQSFAPDATTAYLKQQPGLFRVFPLGQLFMDNTLPYHQLHSVGGYSPAKLKIYQTLLDSCMYSAPDRTFPLNMAVVNMLNVEFLQAPGRLPEGKFETVYEDAAKRVVTYRNPQALPRAWYAREVAIRTTDHDVFATLNDPAFDPSRTAILYAPPGEQLTSPDSSAVPVITRYRSREITLTSDVSAPALLVLSEIYYPAGWKAFLDGKEIPIYRTNYLLRSVVVPAGKHEVVFTYDPALYRVGYMLSNIGWGVALLCVGIGAVTFFRKRAPVVQ
jgi:hypothetical protein